MKMKFIHEKGRDVGIFSLLHIFNA